LKFDGELRLAAARVTVRIAESESTVTAGALHDIDSVTVAGGRPSRDSESPGRARARAGHWDPDTPRPGHPGPAKTLPGAADPVAGAALNFGGALRKRIIVRVLKLDMP
jgi:hypothetical protein